MSGDGNDQLQLTDDPGDDIMPAVPPLRSGTIIFSSNRNRRLPALHDGRVTERT